MEKPEIEVVTIDAAELSEPLNKHLKRVEQNKARVVVEQDGKPVAVLVSPLDYERIRMLDRRAEDGWQAIKEIQARNAHFNPEEVERDVAEAIEEMRAEQRAQEAQAKTHTGT